MKKMLCLFILFLCLSLSVPVHAGVVAEENSLALQGGALVENIGLETIGGVFTPILETGCKLPCLKTQIFSTAADNQDQVAITLYRGNVALVSEAVLLGRFQITDIPPAPRGTPKIEVEFKASATNIELGAKDLESNKALSIIRISEKAL